MPARWKERTLPTDFAVAENGRPGHSAAMGWAHETRRIQERRMSEETDRADMNRKLVKMTSEEFATGFNKGFGKAYQALWNREFLLIVIVLLWVIGMTIYRHFTGWIN
jgi:hypothetical protein